MIGRIGNLKILPKIEIANVPEVNFTVRAEAWMVPKVQILVHYIHETGEIVYDLLTLDMMQELPNEVKNCFLISKILKATQKFISVKTRAF